MSSLFPLDFDALKKGDVITQEQIERIYKVSCDRNARDFHLAAMRLMGDIEQRRDDLLVRICGNSVQVMTDIEACDTTARRIDKHVRGIARDAGRRGRINREGFSDEQKRVAETRDQFAGALKIATRKLLREEETKRLLGSHQPSEGGEE